MVKENPRLVVAPGTAQEKEFELMLATVVLGREPINDLFFVHSEVSRRHARLTRRGDGYLLEDLGSTNGTYLNGVRVDTAVFLHDGDLIDLGETVRLMYINFDPTVTTEAGKRLAPLADLVQLPPPPSRPLTSALPTLPERPTEPELTPDPAPPEQPEKGKPWFRWPWSGAAAEDVSSPHEP
jgi:pSer/pThr/pTyr-binding forkhead associated (FHA) protein